MKLFSFFSRMSTVVILVIMGGWLSAQESLLPMPPPPSAPAGTANVKLGWSPSVDTPGFTRAVGYTLWMGTTSGLYTNVWQGTNLQAMIRGLEYGTNYFIVATAYDAQGRKSFYSNEIQYTPKKKPVETITIIYIESIGVFTNPPNHAFFAMCYRTNLTAGEWKLAEGFHQTIRRTNY